VRSRSLLAGVGGLAFGIVTFAGFMVANPPGGDYSVSTIVDYTAKGHRASVFLSLYLVLIGAVGLVLLVARLRDAVTDGRRASLFWALGVAAATAWVAGYALVVSVPAAYAFGGGKDLVLTNGVVYAFAEAGWAVMYGAGGILLGCALVTFAAGPVAVPSWVRWATLVAGVCGIAGLAWFPFFVVYLWAIVLGLWTLVADRAEAPRPVSQPA
jgi:MFS family permease